MLNRIRYRGGYKYQLVEDYRVLVAVRPAVDVRTRFIELSREGWLVVRAGYAWDGPSGPAIDSRNFMRGALVHDALYQLMREGWLDEVRWRKRADEELVRICGEDGMFFVRRLWVYLGVRWGGELAASPAGVRAALWAP